METMTDHFALYMHNERIMYDRINSAIERLRNNGFTDEQIEIRVANYLRDYFSEPNEAPNYPFVRMMYKEILRIVMCDMIDYRGIVKDFIDESHE